MELKIFVLCFALHSVTGYKILYPPQTPSTRIVGGVDAADGQAPFQCSIHERGKHVCGCAILSSQWIVTAAHCFRGRFAEDITILVGTNYLKTMNGTYYGIEKFIAHENHDNPRYAYDIAVVRTNQTIEYNDKVQPIKCSSDEVQEGAVAQLFGWGLTDQLQMINLTVISTSKCREINGNGIHDSHLCTFNKKGEGSCYGDSGGPLILNDKLIGVVNWGYPCAKGYPDAFAKISYLNEWIEKNTEINYNE